MVVNICVAPGAGWELVQGSEATPPCFHPKKAGENWYGWMNYMKPMVYFYLQNSQEVHKVSTAETHNFRRLGAKYRQSQTNESLK